HRGSGTEPVNVLSRYRYQDGLAYYETTRDTASHFFIDYMPKGTYVFEYATRVVHKGQYQTGVAQIQCMYAPEFNSHSESIPLDVKGIRGNPPSPSGPARPLTFRAVAPGRCLELACCSPAPWMDSNAFREGFLPPCQMGFPRGMSVNPSLRWACGEKV